MASGLQLMVLASTVLAMHALTSMAGKTRRLCARALLHSDATSGKVVVSTLDQKKIDFLVRLAPAASQAYELRGAGAVLHSHSLNAVAATLLDQGCSEFRATHLEMIKARRCLVSLPDPRSRHQGTHSDIILACISAIAAILARGSRPRTGERLQCV